MDRQKSERQRDIWEPPPWDPELHPAVASVSAGMLVKLVPVLKQPAPPEFAYVPVSRDDHATLATMSMWNMTWQSGGAFGNWRTYRDEQEDLPPTLRRILDRIPDDDPVDLRLLPLLRGEEEASFLCANLGLYQLLPLKVLQRFGLPHLGRSTWPTMPWRMVRKGALGRAPAERLSRAVAVHLWPLLCSQSGLDAFSENDPLRLLAHDLDYWLPYIDQVIRRRMRTIGHVPFEDDEQRRNVEKAKEQLGPEYDVERPLYHADAWVGEEEAWDAAQEMVALADSAGRLRGIVDAVRRNRIEDDFSDRWSFAKEDFERKLYHKRSKCRVTFVELDDTVPVFSRHAELEENLLWRDLFTVVDTHHRNVVVCLRSGVTRVTEIADVLGYANHSPVSKQLARIREKAKKLLH